MWKWIVGTLAVIVLLIAAAGAWFVGSGKLDEVREQFDPSKQKTQVRLGLVERGSVVNAINAPGQLEPDVNIEISAQVSARIVELPFEENAKVKAGDVVVRLDDRDLVAQLDSAKAALKSEEARLEGSRAALSNAETELARRKQLLSTGDATQTEVDSLQLEYERSVSNLRQTEQSIEQARARIRLAEKDLSNSVITSPVDGVITSLNAEVGETVVVGTLNNPGSVIMTIADLSVMLVKTRVDEANIREVAEGQRAVVYINAYPDRKFAGSVQHVGLQQMRDRDNTPYFETEIKLDRTDDVVLRSGLTSNADIEVKKHEGVLKVPTQAVQDRAVDDLPSAVIKDNTVIDKTKKFARVVFAEKDGKAVAVPVTVGDSDQTHTIITAGLEEGQKVVIGPFKVLTSLKHDQNIIEEGTEPKNKKNEKKSEPKVATKS